MDKKSPEQSAFEAGMDFGKRIRNLEMSIAYAEKTLNDLENKFDPLRCKEEIIKIKEACLSRLIDLKMEVSDYEYGL